MRPRNTLVLVRLHLEDEERVGNITVPTDNFEYTEATVLAVGPGSLHAEGGRTETFDLSEGDLVLVKHKRRMQRPGAVQGSTQVALMDQGLKLRQGGNDAGDLYIFEQNDIIAVLDETQSDLELVGA